MAKVKLPLSPELTPEILSELVGRTVAGVEVRATDKLPGADFVVARSDWEGVAVKLKQNLGSTAVTLNGVIPRFVNRLVFIPLVLLAVLPGLAAIVYFNLIKPRQLIGELEAAILREHGEAAPDS